MKENKIAYACLLLGSTFLGAVGQALFKVGVVGSAMALVEFVLLGLVCYGVSTLVYFYVLSRSHLSWAYGFTGLSYVFASLIAVSLLSEKVPVLRWVGIAIITVGTVLIGFS